MPIFTKFMNDFSRMQLQMNELLDSRAEQQIELRDLQNSVDLLKNENQHLKTDVRALRDAHS